MKYDAIATAVFPLAIACDLRDSERELRSQCHKLSGTNPPLAAPMEDDQDKAVDVDFESLVSRYYRGLYQFAFSLTRREADACDLTQQTFYVWAKKGHQLRDASKVKTWLFTTLHREFLKTRRRQDRFPHVELERAGNDVPTVSPAMVNQLDGATVIEALGSIDDIYQAALALFYMEDHSYKEIAEILAVPIGTVQSRIARGKAQLQKVLLETTSQVEPNKRQRG